MKKLIALALICASITTVSVYAQKATTDEQKALKTEMLAKYDVNKDGKLDKEEFSKMSDEDKAKWKKAFGHHKKKDTTDSSSTNSVSTNAVTK